MKKFTITEMKRLNKEAGQHWFDKGAMNFFNTRIETKPNVANMFLTSEHTGDGNRKFTWRVFNPTTHHVETLGKFMEYETKEDAMKEVHWLKRMVIIAQ